MPEADAMLSRGRTPCHVPEPYSVFLNGTAMWPMYPKGALLFVDPATPPRVGDGVVYSIGGDRRGCARLAGHDRRTVTLEWFTPPVTRVVSRKHFVALHRVMTERDLFAD